MPPKKMNPNANVDGDDDTTVDEPDAMDATFGRQQEGAPVAEVVTRTPHRSPGLSEFKEQKSSSASKKKQHYGISSGNLNSSAPCELMQSYYNILVQESEVNELIESVAPCFLLKEVNNAGEFFVVLPNKGVSPFLGMSPMCEWFDG